MRNKKIKIILIFLVLLGVVGFFYLKVSRPKPSDELIKELQPILGTIQNTFSTTGTVLPKNRLEIKPPVSGRVEEILVKEGEEVKAGQTLAWMSSTERAALLDAARGQGAESLKYWKEVYKAIPLISPIDGEVIVAITQPGQTVTTADAIIVLSDKLIVRAQVDETDIGKVKLGQDALIMLDAYPDTKIKGKVEHMYYESETVNNVTIYKVDLIPENVPDFFRSGMNATINFIENNKENILTLPIEAVIKEKDGDYVLLKQVNTSEPLKSPVKLGIADGKNIEIISGVSSSDTIILKTKKFILPKTSMGSNPFMPFGRKKQDTKK